MEKIKKDRIVMKKVNGMWLEIEFQQLCDGDIFRMFEPTDVVVGFNDITEFQATSNPYRVSNTYEIKCVYNTKDQIIGKSKIQVKEKDEEISPDNL